MTETTTADDLPADVAAYVDTVAGPRRELFRAAFETVRDAVPEGYELVMAFGMPCWVVPLERFPDTYNGEPLSYVAVAAQKQYVSVYLMGVYSVPGAEEEFRAAWSAATGRVDMGKSCLRLKKGSDLAADLLATTVAAQPVEEFLATYERVRAR